jgi:transposase-like protein
MRNLLEPVQERDYDTVKADAQAIYQAAHVKRARAAFQRFHRR